MARGTARGLTTGLTWPFLLLALASLFVYMAGLAAVQNVCYGDGMPGVPLNGDSSPTGVFGMSSGIVDCKRLYRFYWFSFAFVLVTLLGIMVAAVLSLGLIFSRPFWIGMLAVSTLLMMIASEAFLAFTDLVEANSSGQWVHRMRTTTAGAIMTVAFLVFLMMAIGTDWERRRGDGTATTKPVAGTGVGGTGPAVADPAVTNV
jgi:magnesium-transporting ATPase (P-type)